MTEWIRFNYKQDTSLFGILVGDYVDEYEGNPVSYTHLRAHET